MAGRKGFTLMELMFVIIIIGALASLAIQRYSVTFEKMRAAEGFQILESLRNAQHAHMAEMRSYSDTIGALDVDVPNPANFDPVTDADITNDPANLAQVTRSTGDYTLSIDEDGVITCADGVAGACARIGCGAGTCN